MDADVQFENWDRTVLSKNATLISLDSRSVRLGHHIMSMQQREDNGTECADGEQLQG